MMCTDESGKTLLSPAGAVMTAAFEAYIDDGCTPAGRERGRRLVRAMLEAAEKHGYRYGAQLHAMLIGGVIGPQGVDMLIRAVGLVPRAEVIELVLSILGPSDASLS